MDFIFNKIAVDDSRPIREVVLEDIRNAIFEGKLKRGDRLVENVIASSMGVSRTPVREALRQLEIEGLAQNIPRKGTIVKGISIEDAIEIYDIREVLEGLAVRLACLNLSRIEMRELRKITELMRESMLDNNYVEYEKANEKFNHLVISSSKNKRLIKDIESINEYLKTLRKVSLVKRDSWESVIHECEKILEAIEKGDEILAENLSREHIIHAKNRFIESYNE